MASSEARPTVGEIAWVEIPIVDGKRAAAFYTAVLGWECQTEQHPSPLSAVKGIQMFNKGRLHGCFLAVTEADIPKTWDADNAARSSVLLSFNVPDLEEALGAVEKNGGKVVVPRTEIGNGMGCFARFVDTEGNLQGLYASK